MKIQEGLREKWNLPHALGAIEGKRDKGNYKGFHSMDADYKFIWFDFAAPWPSSDS